MRRRQKVSGFTLLELLVSMALTTMVLFIGQYIFSAFKGFTLTYDMAIDYTYELSILQQQLDRDLERAKKCQWEKEQQSFCLEYHKEEGPCYKLAEGKISRYWQDSKGSWELEGELIPIDSLGQLLLRDTTHHLSFRFTLPKEGRARL